MSAITLECRKISFENLDSLKNNQYRKIINALKYYGDLTRIEIHAATDIKETSLCGRLKELVNARQVTETGVKKGESGRPNTIYGV